MLLKRYHHNLRVSTDAHRRAPCSRSARGVNVVIAYGVKPIVNAGVGEKRDKTIRENLSGVRVSRKLEFYSGLFDLVYV